MWALVKANQVIEIIMFPKSIESSGIVYNKNIFSKSATEQKKIGLYSVIIDKPADERFEMNSVTTYALDSKKEKVIQTIKKKEKKLNDVTQVDADGKDILDENGNKVITKGLKSFYIESIKQQANTLLKPSDWLVHRFVEDNTKPVAKGDFEFVAPVVAVVSPSASKRDQDYYELNRQAEKIFKIQRQQMELQQAKLEAQQKALDKQLKMNMEKLQKKIKLYEDELIEQSKSSPDFIKKRA